MGWKNVKEHYRIEHFVQVTPAGLCIGSSYIHDIIVIRLQDDDEGMFLKRYQGMGGNKDLERYQAEMDADLVTLRELIRTPDTFTASLPVYTWEDGKILEKHCEEYGYPNVTHDGQMMYENMFSPSYHVTLDRAIKDAEAGVRLAAKIQDDRRKALDRAVEISAQRRRELDAYRVLKQFAESVAKQGTT